MYATVDEQRRGKIKADQGTWLKQIDDQMKAYAATSLVADEVALLKEWQQAFPAHVQARQRTLELADQGKADESIAHRDGVAGPLYGKANDALNRLIQVQDQVSAATEREISAQATTSIMQLLGLTVSALVVGCGVAFFLSRSIANGVQDIQRTLTSLTDQCGIKLSEALEAMARNDLTVVVTPVTPPITRFSSDEIGETARVTNRMRDRVVATIASYEQARMGLQAMIGEVQESATSVPETSEQLGRAASQTSGGVQQVTMAVQNVAAGSQETSRAASETNEHGRGFAVVADEVRKLALREPDSVASLNHALTDGACDFTRPHKRSIAHDPRRLPTTRADLLLADLLV